MRNLKQVREKYFTPGMMVKYRNQVTFIYSVLDLPTKYKRIVVEGIGVIDPELVIPIRTRNHLRQILDQGALINPMIKERVVNHFVNFA